MRRFRKLNFEFGTARPVMPAPVFACESANRNNGSETVNGVDTNLGSRKRPR